MNQDKLNYRYERIGEISYWIMLIFTIALITAATVVTGIVRKALGTEITLVPIEILNFVEKILWVFVLPVSLKIGGETFYKTILVWKGYPINENNTTKTEHYENSEYTKQNYSPQDIQKQYEVFHHTSNMYDLNYEKDDSELSTQRKRKKT